MFRATPRRRLPNSLVNFGKSDEGSLTVFALCLFFLMVIMAGVAIDVTRYETTRTALQNTLDRCTLMAAALDQRLTPEEVVRDCVSKAGMADQLESIHVVSGMNLREVKSQGRAASDPLFMHMIGIETMDALAVSTAVQSISNIELALVLDVSGSMAGAKIERLKVAASDFVDTVLASDHDNRLSIALVPYNGQVNLGANLRSQFNVTDLHGVADVNCIDLPANVYTATSMSQTAAMPMTGNVDSYSNTWMTWDYLSRTDGWALPHPLNKWCPPSTTNTVRMPSNNGTTLKAQINALTAVGATSINAGLKWGLTLLDPASRAAMAGTGQMPTAFAGRPFDYTDPKATKIIVLMTDGEHFAEERLNAGFRTGASPIRRSNGDGEYSIRHADRAGPNKYWVPHRSAWQANAWNSGSGVTQLNWDQVWAAQRMSYVAWQMYGRALGNNDPAQMTAAYDAAMAMFRSKTATTAMDAQLQQVCTMAKDQNVIIYGIAFEAPTGGQAQILQCASSEEYYFNANGPEIETAFSTIANNITQLRLTQ
jgi:Flp pilus assembly protein TadG